MACYIFGAGSFYGLTARPRAGDFTIAADGGWLACRKTEVIPDLLLGDFDSLSAQPDFPNILRVPVEKDDTDTMLAVKTGLERGETEFHIYGGMAAAGRTTPLPISRRYCIWPAGVHGAGCMARVNDTPPFPAIPSHFRPGTGAYYPCSVWGQTLRTSASWAGNIPCTTLC